MDEIERIIKNKSNYLEVLGVTRQSTQNEIKKNYKRLSLLVHPDRNKNKGAEEAFMILNKAYEEVKKGVTEERDEKRGERWRGTEWRGNEWRGTDWRSARRYHSSTEYVNLEELVREIFRSNNFNQGSGYTYSYNADNLNNPVGNAAVVMFVLILVLSVLIK